LRGEAWGDEDSPQIHYSRIVPLTQIAPDDASHRRGDPTSPRKRGEVTQIRAPVQLKDMALKDMAH
jgi:hypothetical protein